MTKLTLRKKFYVKSVLFGFLSPLLASPFITIFIVTDSGATLNLEDFGIVAMGATLYGALYYAPFAACLLVVIMYMPEKLLRHILFWIPLIFATLLAVWVIFEFNDIASAKLFFIIAFGTALIYVALVRGYERKWERQGKFEKNIDHP